MPRSKPPAYNRLLQRTGLPAHTGPVTEQSLLPMLILQLTEAVGRSSSISPEDAAHAVAKAVGQDADPDAWHRYLSAVRRAAIRMAMDGQIEILRKGKPVPPEGVKGVIRLRIAAVAEG